MNTAESKVALLVHSCDRYSLLYKGFEYFFNNYWPHTIPCNYYFATEEKTASVKGFENILSGSGEWSDRLSYLLKEKIKEEYILYMQEDMWLKHDVNEQFFLKLFVLAKQHNWQQVKLHSSEVYITTPTEYNIEGFTVAKLNNAASDFLMSHQVTLWNKNFLLGQMFKGEHPWRNERRGTKRLKHQNPDIYQVDYFAENDKPPINNNNNPVGRSGYNTISVNGMLNVNVPPFIDELMKGNDEERAYAAKLKYNFEHQLTHDGRPKPRKESLVKKLKKKLAL